MKYFLVSTSQDLKQATTTSVLVLTTHSTCLLLYLTWRQYVAQSVQHRLVIY